MPSDIFQKLKANRGTSDNVSSLLSQIDKVETKSFDDERQWKLTVDQAGNGSAIIRFLPGPKDEKFEKLYNHAFKNPLSGKWFIENCPTTIGLDCPVCSENTKQWSTGIPQNQEIVRVRKRNLKYISNIYVVADPKNKEAEGRVFLFKYGPKIFEKIKLAAKPLFPGVKPCNVFDMWEGANFQLLCTMVKKQRNYDSSVFESRSQLIEDEEVLQKIWESQFALSEFVDPAQFKSYVEIEKKFKDFCSSGETNSSVRDHIQPESYASGAVDTSEDKSSKYQKFLDKFSSSSEEDDDIPF